MARIKIKRKKYNTKGTLGWEYNPLRNIISKQNDEGGVARNMLSDFDVNLTLDINHPVDIECQSSYDGSTNIIFNDDYNVPRIVNSGFTVKEDNTYERVSRNQMVQTNTYREAFVDSETRLQRTSNKFMHIDLIDVSSGGELKGGNYVFLFQYSDDDSNKSRIVAESGVVSIFHGKIGLPHTIHGTLLNEITDKKIKLQIRGVDHSYSKIYVSYKREYSDTNGVKMTEYVSLTEPFNISDDDSDSMSITIDGRIPESPTSYAALTMEYTTYNKVKTQTQNQNVLFFGNVEEHTDDMVELQKLSLYIGVKPFLGNSVGYVNTSNFDGAGGEYFNPNNIYYNLGYMPEEFYRLGIVYIYNDDSKSGVYNLRGCNFLSLNSWNIGDFSPSMTDGVNINELFIDGLCNTKGVFKMPYVDLYKKNNIHPLLLEFKVPDTVLKSLNSMGIKGYFFVRQPRIPIFLMQAYSVGISDNAYTPILSYYQSTEDGTEHTMFMSSPFDNDGSKIKIGRTNTTFSKYGGDSPETHFRGLIGLDVINNPQLQSMFNGSEFKIKAVRRWNCSLVEGSKMIYANTESIDTGNAISRELIYVPKDTPYRSYKNSIFSTKAGSSSDVLSLRSLENKTNFKINKYCVRGNYIPFIGVVSGEGTEDIIEGNTVYNIYTSEYSDKESDINIQIKTRSLNKSEYFAISDPIEIVVNGEYNITNIRCARGDCFTCTAASKFQWNYLDQNVPLNEKIVVESVGNNTNKIHTKKYSEITPADWTEFNVSDVNAVDLGHIFVYKYMSNFNSIRVIDYSNVDEISLFGNPRSFYPYSKDIQGIAFKINDSSLSNEGLSSIKLLHPYYESEQVPYTKKLFDTRIAFSNVASAESFSNGYKVFTNLSYKDIERTYGAIVKLVPFGPDLFCVFEHGCGIIPVNQKALLSTSTGQSILLSGDSVLQSQVTVVSQDYGSTWEESILVTPSAIYGVDTFAKKIWKYSEARFELISDQIVQRYLNDNITLSEGDIYPTIAITNVKTHYNNYKGDVMFTFYDGTVKWNLCYNERINKFITRYSWVPLLSDNIQNSYVSIDQEAVSTYALIAENQTKANGLTMSGNSEEYRFKYKKENIPYLYEYSNLERDSSEDESCEIYEENTCRIRRAFRLQGFNNMYNAVEAKVLSISYPKWDENARKITIVTHDGNDENGFYIDSSDALYTYNINNGEGNAVYNIQKERAYTTSIVGWGEQKTADDSLTPGLSPSDKYKPDTVEEEIDNIDEIDSVNISNFKSKYKNYVQTSLGGDLDLEVKLDSFVSWIKIKLLVTPYIFNLEEEQETDVLDFGNRDTKIKGESFEQTICLVADYDYIKNAANGEIEDLSAEEYKKYLDECDNILRVGLFTHGRAGIYDEINYFDNNPDNNIKPTFWYNKQEPFEFEFVVNSPVGLQKIFDNLVIISNNAEPNSLEFSIIGDSYDFNKAGIFRAQNTEPERGENGLIKQKATALEKLKREFGEAIDTVSQTFKNLFQNDLIAYDARIQKDPVLEEYSLVVSENCRNAASAKRRLGNIEYREDKWLVNISPIYFKKHKRVDANSTDTIESKLQSAKLRDKWIKIRIKYKGDRLVVISAIQTLMTLSYA